MKEKKFGIYILLSILLLLTVVCILDLLGLFDPFVKKYDELKLAEELKNISTSHSSNINTSSSPSVSKSTDTDTGASISPAPSAPQPVKEEISVTPVNLLSSQSVVSIIQSEKKSAFDINSEEIKAMVNKAVDLAGGFADIIHDGQVVVLKPNLVQIHSDITGKRFVKEVNGITTDWRVTKAVAELVRKYNPTGKVYVMEGSAGDRTKEAYKYLNYTHDSIPGVDEFIALEDSSGGWQEFDSPKLAEVDLPDGLLHKSYYLNKLYKEADVLISLPCLKNNSGTVITGGIKNVGIGAAPANIYGLSQQSLSRVKMVSHSIAQGDLDKWIYDYYMCKPVNFVIMDGLQGFQNGPVPYKKDSEETDIMNMRLIIAGKDAVAVDTVEALVTGWDPLSAKYLRYLNASSMGNIDTKHIEVLGKQVDEVRKFFKTKIKNSGGIEIKDTNPPSLEINSLHVDGNSLYLNLAAAKETVKSEVFIDNKLSALITAYSSDTFTININNLSKGSHGLRVLSYDRFLNHSEQNASLEK